MLPILFKATYETLKLVFTTSVIIVMLGLPLGIGLEATSNHNIWGTKYLWLHNIIRIIIDVIINIPVFLTLLILMFIINGFLFEYFTLELSAVISLVLVGTCMFAQDIFKTLHNLPKELSETAILLGAESWQVLTKFLLPESIYNVIHNITKLIINLIGLAIMVSMLGVNGLGKLALEKGYHEANLTWIFYIILLATGMIYIVEFIGDLLANYLYHKQSSHNNIIL